MCMQVGSMYAMDGRRHGRGVGGLCRWRRTRLGGVLYSRVRRLASPWTGCACMQETVRCNCQGWTVCRHCRIKSLCCM